MRKYFAVILLFVTSVMCSFAQPQNFVTLKWSDTIVYTVAGDSVARPFFFEGASFSECSMLPFCHQLFKIDDSASLDDYKISLEFPEYQSLPEFQKRAFRDYNLRVSPKIELYKELRNASGKKYIEVKFVPFAFRDGEFKRLVSFRLNIEKVANPKTSSSAFDNSKEFLSNSVLAAGKWVKIAVQQSGVYSISNKKLASLGFTDPSKVAIFGYGGAMLYEDFSMPYTDDLPEVPVVRTGNSILFYAQGVLREDFVADSKGGYWFPTTNVYSDYAYYFITEKDNPAQFQVSEDIPQSADVKTTVNAYSFYNGDAKFAWAEFGTRLYDSYDFRLGNKKSYTIDLPGVVSSSSARVNVAFAASKSSTSNFLTVYSGGEQLAKTSDMRTSSTSSQLFAIRRTLTGWKDNISSSKLNLMLEHDNSKIVSGHFEYILVNYERNLSMEGPFLYFAVPTAKTGTTYRISNANSSTVVWDVTTPGQYRQMKTEISGSDLTFTDNLGGLRRYVAVKTNEGHNEGITVVGDVANQNLHSLRNVDMVIIVPSGGLLTASAERLAEKHRQKDGLNVVVVNAGDIYNEFSSGTPDATAYRRFMKMIYDTAGDKTKSRYLLLFGDCSFDNRLRTPEWSAYSMGDQLLCYQHTESENETLTFITDDYFGFLDDNEGKDVVSAKNVVDIGIGRIPVRTQAEAEGVVDKLIRYMDNADKGAWKNSVCYAADDNLDDGGTIHMEQADGVASYVESLKAGYVVERLFLDIYKREATSTGYSYPQANKRLQEMFKDGMLVLTYIGHSNPSYWSSKKLLTNNDIIKLKSERIPFWITASCEFSRIDALLTSAGELAMTNSAGGAVGLFTTARVVFISDNDKINKIFQKYLFTKKDAFSHRTLGEIYMNTKQECAMNSSANRNDLNFILLGDPAITLNYPDFNKMEIDSINGKAVGEDIQMKAGSIAEVSGRVVDANNQELSDFSGSMNINVMDSKELQTTLNNAGIYDDEGVPDTIQFLSRVNRIYLGIDSVRNGKFNVKFPVPLDINYSNQSGFISLYSTDGTREANFGFEDFTVGGAEDISGSDGEGPEIIASLNSKTSNSYRVNESPVLYLSLLDEDGLNISGSGLGHDIVAIVDDDPNYSYNLNSYYIPSGLYTRGDVVFKIPYLPEGKHSMLIRAWDALNNSSTKILEFEVVKGLEPVLFDVSCVSPAIGQTTFFINHDRPDSDVSVRLEIFDYSGSIVHRIDLTDYTYNEFFTYTWDLRCDSGAPLNPGVYLYKLTFSAGGESVTKTKKMVVLRQ